MKISFVFLFHWGTFPNCMEACEQGPFKEKWRKNISTFMSFSTSYHIICKEPVPAIRISPVEGKSKESKKSRESRRSLKSWEPKRPRESPWESFEGSGVCPRREDASGEENATQSSLRLCQCHFFSSPPSISKNSNFGNKNRVGKHWGWAGWECHSSLYLPTSQVRQVVSEVF